MSRIFLHDTFYVFSYSTCNPQFDAFKRTWQVIQRLLDKGHTRCSMMRWRHMPPVCYGQKRLRESDTHVLGNGWSYTQRVIMYLIKPALGSNDFSLSLLLRVFAEIYGSNLISIQISKNCFRFIRTYIFICSARSLVRLKYVWYKSS
jgi:hypothetical protein